ncbi:hypothetical protein QYF36_016235 [Acer negundo]|nr:hypothetical protein QYF36_016235 [Acer negundo]
MRAKFPPMAEMFSRLPPPLWGSGPLRALKRRTGTSGINVFQFLALHRPSNGPWTKRPLPERTMSRGPPPPPQVYLNQTKRLASTKQGPIELSLEQIEKVSRSREPLAEDPSLSL